MYYKEAWINGKLCWKSSPRGEWIPFTIGQYKERVKQLEEQVKNLTLAAVSSLLLIEERGFDDMVRRFNLPKDHDDYLCNDDTQIGWEECFKYIKAQLSNNR